MHTHYDIVWHNEQFGFNFVCEIANFNPIATLCLTSSDAYCAMQFKLNKPSRYCTLKIQIGSPSSNAINPENKRRKSLIASRYIVVMEVAFRSFMHQVRKLQSLPLHATATENVWQCLLNRIEQPPPCRKMLYCWMPFGERIPKAPSTIPHIRRGGASCRHHNHQNSLQW